MYTVLFSERMVFANVITVAEGERQSVLGQQMLGQQCAAGVSIGPPCVPWARPFEPRVHHGHHHTHAHHTH